MLLEAVAEVVWADTSGEHMGEFGVRFVQLGEDVDERIRAFVKMMGADVEESKESDVARLSWAVAHCWSDWERASGIESQARLVDLDGDHGAARTLLEQARHEYACAGATADANRVRRRLADGSSPRRRTRSIDAATLSAGGQPYARTEDMHSER